MIQWWLPPEQRQEKKKRKPYKRGAKAFLASFEIGEIRVVKDEYSWDGMRSSASRMKKDFGCQFHFSLATGKKVITRIA